MRWLIVLLLCLFSSYAEARGGGSTPPICTASPPAQASSVNFTNLVFCDTLATTQTIDISNTRNPGFNWYWPLHTTDTAPSASGNLNDGTGSYVEASENSMTTASGNSNNIGVTGPTFRGGFYAEVSMKWTASGCASNWPVFWFLSTTAMDNNPQTFPNHEIDVFEFNNCNTPGLTNVYEFTNSSAAGYGNTGNQPTIAGPPDYTVYHTYGVLWVTQAQAGGAGYIKFYFDNTLESTLTYQTGQAPSPSTCRGPTSAYSGSTTCPLGTFSAIENDAFTIILQGVKPYNASNRAVYKNVHVWQASR